MSVVHTVHLRARCRAKLAEVRQRGDVYLWFGDRAEYAQFSTEDPDGVPVSFCNGQS
jgi:hypothetical protein